MLALGLFANAEAGEWDIVLNGKSIHVDADKEWNEANWGLGFEREFNPDERWVKVALGNGFKDSDDEMSYMAGGGIKRRFRMPRIAEDFHVDVGAVGFLMTRKDVAGNRPFPGILPAVSVGNRQFAVNFTYLPGHVAERVANARTADPNLDGIVFVQFKFNARLFGFGGNARSREAFAANTPD
ncbi:MAG: hypothetical protein R3305_04430 [Gammaproteobacteria bacterium]|nr:hypothetical protein [Gammaproteobacteria bacterium]